MWVDIAILGIILLFAIVGLLKGFMKTLLSFAGAVLAIILSYFLTKPVVAALAGSNIESFVSEKVLSVLSGIGGMMTTEIPSYEVLVEQLSASVPVYVAESLANSISEYIGTAADQTLAELLTPGLTNILLNIIVFIVLFIAFMIVFAILKSIAKAFKSIKLIDFIDKVLGFALGAVLGVAFVYFVLLIFTFLTGMEGITPIIDSINASKIGSVMYNQNLIVIIFKQLVDTGTINPDAIINALPSVEVTSKSSAT